MRGFGRKSSAPPPPPERAQAFLYAFDLLELNGTDLRREPIEVRKRLWATSFGRAVPVCD